MFSRPRHVEIFEILVQDVAFTHLGGGFGCGDGWIRLENTTWNVGVSWGVEASTIEPNQNEIPLNLHENHENPGAFLMETE